MQGKSGERIWKNEVEWTTKVENTKGEIKFLAVYEACRAYFDLFVALKREPLIALGSQQRGPKLQNLGTHSLCIAQSKAFHCAAVVCRIPPTEIYTSVIPPRAPTACICRASVSTVTVTRATHAETSLS